MEGEEMGEEKCRVERRGELRRRLQEIMRNDSITQAICENIEDELIRFFKRGM